MIYVLTEWNGKGSGEKVLVTNEKSKAMSMRECTLTAEAAKKRYGKDFFFANDVKCSTIDSFTSERALREGIVKTSNSWY